MPHCLNNPKRTYKGNEPSPKGLGYCASGEKEGKKMKGKDGNMWKKQNGRWIKYTKIERKETKLDCKNFVRYEMRKNTNIYSISGISADKGYIYKWLDYNKFEKKPTEIPKGYRKVKLSKDWIKEFGCGNRKRIEEITWDKSFHKGYTTYLIHDNGGRPFLVAIKGKKVKIYRIDPKIYSYADKIQKYYYTYLINEYTTKKIFIGKSPKNKLTEYSGGFGKYFDGNSILLELTGGKYIYIGSEIYQFTPKSTILSFTSPVGNSDIPYPFAMDEENIYFMLYAVYVPIKYLPKMSKTQMTDLYAYFYGHDGNIPLEKYGKKIKGVKMIQKRL